MKKIIISIENSSFLLSICINLNNKFLYIEKITKKNSSFYILKLINKLLLDNNINIESINAISFGSGPGKFTNIRTICAVSKSLSIGWKIPIIKISSMKSIALETYLKTGYKNILAAVDIGKNKIYYNIYEFKNNKIFNLVKEENIEVEKVNFLNNKIICVGDGCINYKDILVFNNPKINLNKKIIFPKSIYNNLIARENFNKNKFDNLYNSLPTYL